MDPPAIFDKLCEVCSSLFDDQASEYFLSKGITTPNAPNIDIKFERLVLAARQGSHLCNIMYNSLGDLTRLPHLHEPIHPRYANTTLSLSMKRLPYASLLSLWGGGLIGFLEISRISARKMENMRASRATPTQKLSTSSISQIKDWVSHCKINHRHCRTGVPSGPSAPRKLPTRLIHVKSDGNLSLQIRNTRELDTEITYMTLSHCWGRHTVISLSKNNLAEFESLIPFQNLPKTFRDAIEVTESLGCQYIWIDSLCIIQDSNDDWLHESSFIGDIYRNAVLNLAATASVDGNGGLFYNSKSLALHPCIINFEQNSIDQTFICHNQVTWKSQVEKAPLARRAWVVQERSLSPRIAHFAKDQIYWECHSNRDSELLPELSCSDEDLNFLKEISTDPRYIYDRWDETVMRYTQCLLTFESDKLIAISGLARQACQQLGGEPSDYLAGLWAGNMPTALLWRTNPHIRWRKRVLERAPSWSWACINGEIFGPNLQSYDGQVLDNGLRAGLARAWENFESQTYSRFISADIKHLGDSFGIVTEGSIRLQGPLCEIQTLGSKGTESLLELSHGFLDCKTGAVTIETKSIRWDDGDASLEGTDGSAFFLLIEVCFGWCRGLVLKPLASEPSCYHRLGQIMARPSDLDKLLDISRNPALLGRERYRVSDSNYGFTIDIK